MRSASPRTLLAALVAGALVPAAGVTVFVTPVSADPACAPGRILSGLFCVDLPGPLPLLTPPERPAPVLPLAPVSPPAPRPAHHPAPIYRAPVRPAPVHPVPIRPPHIPPAPQPPAAAPPTVAPPVPVVRPAPVTAVPDCPPSPSVDPLLVVSLGVL